MDKREIMKQVTLPDGTKVPAIGQGTWYLGEAPEKERAEIEALRTGIERGLTLIDTAEMYGEGKAETLIGKVIKKYDRDKLFLVSKVYPWNAGGSHIFESCAASLKRLGTDYLDLYLLHWRGTIPLDETVYAMEELIRRGWIRRWGVSNFDTEDMEELFSLPGGSGCAVDQVLYHAAARGIEYDLLPWLRARHVPAMAYCPLAQAGQLKKGLWSDPLLRRIAASHHGTVSQVLLAFVIRSGKVIAIPRSGDKAHTLLNADAASLTLTEEELAAIDAHFPAPRRKVPLEMV